jgi:hypothetical protein
MNRYYQQQHIVHTFIKMSCLVILAANPGMEDDGGARGGGAQFNTVCCVVIHNIIILIVDR